MSVEIRWANTERTLLQMDFYDNWAFDDFQRAYKRAKLWITEQPYPVDILVDGSHQLSIPLGNNVFNMIEALVSECGEKLGVAIVVVAPCYLRVLSNGMTTVYRRWSQNMRFTSSHDTAFRWIYENQAASV